MASEQTQAEGGGDESKPWKNVAGLLAGSALVLMQLFDMIRGLGVKTPRVEDDLFRAVEFEEAQARKDKRAAMAAQLKAEVIRETAKEQIEAYRKRFEESERRMDMRSGLVAREQTAATILAALLPLVSEERRCPLAVELTDELRAELRRTAKVADRTDTEP